MAMHKIGMFSRRLQCSFWATLAALEPASDITRFSAMLQTTFVASYRYESQSRSA